jgi:pyruvate dehydrogenase E2 component (dihydrolipoamide acetyltransferase)
MAQIIGLPKLSPTMEEGVLVRWVKKEGDKVSPGDLVAEVETDKANMDFNIEDDGVLLKLLVKEGDTVKLGAPVAILGKAGEDISALIAQAQGGGGGGGEKAAAKPEKPDAKPEKPEAKPEAKPDVKPAAAPATAAPTAPAGAKPEPKPAAKAAAPAKSDSVAGNKGDAGARLLASPLAKTLAAELGVDLRRVQGTGPGGRIVERDVRAALDGGAAGDSAGEAAEAVEPAGGAVEPAAAAAPAAKPAKAPAVDLGESYEDVPASNMRKRIAARLTEAKRDIPHFYLQRQVDAAPLLAFRARLNELLGGDKPKISVNDLVLKATALALRRVPECNAAWVGEGIRRFHHVHVGVAVAIEDGLVTPVVRHADLKGLGTIAAEVKDLAERAKHRQLKGHEITGSTFTVSNLGMFGIERFTAILNPPEAGILAVGAVADAAVVKDGAVVAGKRMTVSMSCDHRVIDGALGARWLVAFAELIERPESLAL